MSDWCPCAEVTAIVLAGGTGTRLKSVVSDRPKVLAEFHGRPFIAYILDELAAAGVPRAVISTGFMASKVRDTLGDAHGAMSLRYAEEASPLGTGGAIRHALALAPGETLLAMNGDSLCDVDYNALLTAHLSAKAAATLTLTRVDDSARFGTVALDADGAIARFDEKRPEGGPAWINAGIYALSRAFVESIPEGVAVSIERDVMPRWVGRGLRGFEGGRRFIDIGVPEDHARTADFLASRVRG
jgi:D-glycero-alpha-D-manno-heptose 1-phosphate guanylyltransferase